MFHSTRSNAVTALIDLDINQTIITPQPSGITGTFLEHVYY